MALDGQTTVVVAGGGDTHLTHGFPSSLLMPPLTSVMTLAENRNKPDNGSGGSLLPSCLYSMQPAPFAPCFCLPHTPSLLTLHMPSFLPLLPWQAGRDRQGQTALHWALSSSLWGRHKTSSRGRQGEAWQQAGIQANRGELISGRHREEVWQTSGHGWSSPGLASGE